MRRSFLLVSFVVVFLTMAALCVQAQTGRVKLTVYRLPELKLNISLPSDYCVITRTKVTHPELLKERNIDVKAIQLTFPQSGIFLNAMPREFDSEYVLTSFNYEGSNQIGDFSNYSEEALAELVTPETLAEEYQAMGVDARPEPTERINGKVYFVLTVRQSQNGGGFIYTRQYSTIVGGAAVNLAYNKLTGSINDEEKAKQRAIVESIVFNKS
ncbi:MAG: hypothetical protein LBQ44_07460 [Treponema sp.]|jgi:hypothetical protein|nr:hypothetical protein [Treponema sp.]